MPDQLLSDRALAECKEALRKAVTDVPMEDDVLNSFIEEFRGDFSLVLDHERGEVVWRATRTSMTNRARALGRHADAYALNEGDPKVTREHLGRGLEQVKPYCNVPNIPEVPVPWDYCNHVPFRLQAKR